MSLTASPLVESAPTDSRLERLSAWLLRGPLSLVLAALCLMYLATWVPHYLTWPWYPDHDVFGTMAMGWDRGLLPYKDLLGNNFPGALYLCWVLGKLFGWGKTWPLFAADALMVGGFGLVMITWSRRRLGASLPGLVAYGTFLGYYLSLDYSQVAQRDWQAPCFAVSAILIAEAWPGWLARIVSAAAMGVALLFRPQAVLFLPAIVLAVDESARPLGGPLRRSVGPVIGWGLALALFVALGFLPLVLAGVMDEFLAALRMFAVGGSYNRISPLTIARQMTSQLQTLKIALVPLAIGLFWTRSSPEVRRVARTWLVAWACILLYGPLSPSQHAYLIHPLMVVWAVDVGVLVLMALRAEGLPPSLQLTIVLLVMGLGLALRPRFCNPRASIEAIAYLRQGEDPGPCPTGYKPNIEVPAAAFYAWDDYRDLLAYLRREITPETRIANALKLVPAITGPTARLPAFPAESVAWLTVVRKTDEPLFVKALHEPGDVLVVWSPAEKNQPGLASLSELTATIEEVFEPDRRFGAIEVWKRKGASEKGEKTGRNRPLKVVR